jgi:radical SAM superfamily enzyme YgiQ (UPF0313 family)
VRVRKPELVTTEMLELNQEFGVRVFLFQDDDFPLWGKAGRRWADDLVGRMHASGLAGHSIWKISCRAEYVEPELFTQLRDAGLFRVYMGIESGVAEGLEILHKQLTVEENLAAVRTLKDVGLLFSYGFMLFDPSSSFDSVRENLEFLREIIGDGSAAATFCRMLPYGGTPIRDLLEVEGRLRGDIRRPDYVFLDPRLDTYYTKLHTATRRWLDSNGVSHQLDWAREELEVAAALVDGLEAVDDYRRALTALTAESNERLFRLVEDSSHAYEEDGDESLLDPSHGSASCEDIGHRLLDLRNAFVARNTNALLAGLEANVIRGPIGAPQIH